MIKEIERIGASSMGVKFRKREIERFGIGEADEIAVIDGGNSIFLKPVVQGNSIVLIFRKEQAFKMGFEEGQFLDFEVRGRDVRKVVLARNPRRMKMNIQYKRKKGDKSCKAAE